MHRLSWRLGAVVLAVVTVVILGAGYLDSLVSRRFALDATRDAIHFDSASIRTGIDKLMMSHDNSGVIEFIEDISRRSTTFRDISLVSHPAGRVSVSNLTPTGTTLNLEDRSCALCHVSDDEPALIRAETDEVMRTPDGARVLKVVTPIMNRPSCSTAACHAHADAGPVLGVLTAEYSLASFDDLMTGLNLILTLATVVAILLASGALLVMFHWLLANPLRTLVSGSHAVAEGDLGFRFIAERKDEIGLVEASFNHMAERIQAHQKQLRRALEYLEGIVENTADLVITVNRQGLIQTFNSGAEQTLGYNRAEVEGRRVQMLFADPAERDAAIAKLQEKENVKNWRTRFKTKDGQIRHVLLTLSRLRDRQGNLLGTLGISKDITVELDLQRKLMRSEQEAAIGRAVTAIQHAVKNMLNTLRGGLYILRVGVKNERPEQVDEGAQMIEEGLARISDLSLNMLKHAREWKIEPEPTDMPDMIRRIILAVGQTARERGITLETEIDQELTAVNCDPRLLHMGLMDIVTNAMDACEMKDFDAGETPRIVIRLYRLEDEGEAVIEIEDNGAGMTQEVIDNVFTPFFSTKRRWGTGLGLALTARVIGLHDGRIQVESKPEAGSTFRISLPHAIRAKSRGVG